MYNLLQAGFNYVVVQSGKVVALCGSSKILERSSSDAENNTIRIDAGSKKAEPQ